MTQIPKEEFWKIYKLLPDSLQEAIFSEDTANAIAKACSLAGIEDGLIEQKVGEITGDVLLGLLPPKEFKSALVEEAGISENKAQKISQYINMRVFLPVQEELEKLYAEPSSEKEASSKESELPKEGSSRKNDSYREPIEE